MAAFRRAHPDPRLRLTDLEPPDGYELVVSGELDLLITHRYPEVRLPPTRGLTREALLADRLRLALPAGHPLAAADRLRFEDFAGDDWISGAPQAPNRLCLDRLTPATRVEPPVAYENRHYA